MGISLPSIISSGMVIERHARIWGYSDDSLTDVVQISFCGKDYSACVKNGKWEVFVTAESMGGPYEMRIGDIVLTDVYVGHVFFLGGQSNMETPVGRVRPWYEEDFSNLKSNPRIRAFQVEKDFDFVSPRTDCVGSWRYVSSDTVDNFYAVSFYLSKILENTLDAPVGIVECAVGGSRIESWMAWEDAGFRGYTAALLRLCQNKGLTNIIERMDNERITAWHSDVRENDTGLSAKYYRDGFDDTSWKSRPLTKNWIEDIGLVKGSVWFRKTFSVTDEMEGLPGRLFLGTIIDSDTVYLNGQIVGYTEYRYPPRFYEVPQGLIRKGANTLTARIVCERDIGGFTVGKEYYLELGGTMSAGSRIALDGEWLYKIGYETSELLPSAFFHNYPCGLHNAMLAPVLPFSISAFLWYQGESNAEEPLGYDTLLEKFIGYLRANYFADLPILVVQLPNYDAGELNSNWQLIREQQATVLSLANTALIITNDIGEDNDLHPINKKTLSERLAEGVLHLLRGDALNNKNVLSSKT